MYSFLIELGIEPGLVGAKSLRTTVEIQKTILPGVGKNKNLPLGRQNLGKQP